MVVDLTRQRFGELCYLAAFQHYIGRFGTNRWQRAPLP